jgi:hypothetical protein
MRSSLFDHSRRDGYNDNKAGNNKSAGNKRDQNNGHPARRKLAANHVVLTFEVSVKAKEQDQDCYGEQLAIKFK